MWYFTKYFACVVALIINVLCSGCTANTDSYEGRIHQLEVRIRDMENDKIIIILEVQSIIQELQQSNGTNGLGRLSTLNLEEHGQIGVEFSKLRSILSTWRENETLRARARDYESKNQNLTQTQKCVLGLLASNVNSTVDENSFCSYCQKRASQVIVINGVRLLQASMYKLIDPDLITSFQLEGGAVDRPELIKFLNQTQNLTQLVIRKVAFLAAESPKRVSLPNLKEFVLDVTMQIENQTAFKDFFESALESINPSDLKSLIFFDNPKYPSPNWDIKNAFQLGINIEFSIDSIVLFKVNHDFGEIVSMLGFTNQILENLSKSKRILTRLSIAFVPDLNIDHIPCTDLTHLNLFRVGLGPSKSNTSTLLQQCSKLVELNVCLDQETMNATEKIIFDLSLLPTTLKKLTLEGFILSATDLVTPIELDELNLFWCHFSNEIAQNFSTIFKAKKVSIHTLDSDSNAYALLLELVKSTSAAETIIMTRKKTFATLGLDAATFLLGLGIGLDSEVFLLKKNADGVWGGSKFLGEEWLKNDYSTRFQQFTSFDGYKSYKIF